MPSATLNVRIPNAEKMKAEAILSAIGLNASEAVRMFYRQIIYTGGLPFDLKLPPETIQAMRDAEEGRTEPLTMEELQAQLDAIR